MKKIKLSKKRIEELREIERKAQRHFPFPVIPIVLDEDGEKFIDQNDKEWDGELIHLSYNQLADGSRAKKIDKPIDPETEKAIRAAFDIK